jgi:outer membrane protein assembly factor BamB
MALNQIKDYPQNGMGSKELNDWERDRMTSKRAIVLTGMVWACVAAANAENWPGFRGPTRQGVSAETKVPTSWSATDSIVWKTPIDGQSWSSPIVWGDRVFVTTATEEGQSFRLVCLDRKTGAIVWNNEILRQKTSFKSELNTYATATPVTDGKAVFVLAADGTFAAVSFDGKVLWKHQEFEYYSQHGLGTSPILYNELLIAAFDYSSTGPDKFVGWQKPWDQSFILAVDKTTGQVRWKGKRGLSRIAHVVPNIARVGDNDQLISGAGDVIQGFDLKTGELIWTARSAGEGVVPSIVVGDGLVYSCSGFSDSAVRAVRPDGKGDVTETNIIWETKDDVPHVPTPLYAKPNLYTLTETGVLRCLDGATGKEVWRQRLGGKFSASPVWADGKLYLLSESGKTFVAECGAEYKLAAQNDLGEKCCASPAVSQGNLFIRSEKALYCIGPKL